MNKIREKEKGKDTGTAIYQKQLRRIDEVPQGKKPNVSATL